MKKRVYTEEEKERKITHFQRVIRYRKWFGWVFATVGSVLFFVGVENEQNLMVMINGALFFGYGLFMVRQAKKAAAQLRGSA
jgi:virulence-associated protein VapD